MMRDPFGSQQGFMGQFQGFMQNPIQFLAQRKMNIPQGMSPHDAIQYFMNTGQLSQEQYNWANQQAQRIKNAPFFNRMFH